MEKIILLKNARALDEKGDLSIVEVLIEGKIIKCVEFLPDDSEGRSSENLHGCIENSRFFKELGKTDRVEILDLGGKFISPGFIDMHVHLREPGYEVKETIETGTRAGARGGYTTLACMPNTNPVIDNTETLDFVNEQARKLASTRVLVITAITEGQKGDKLTDFSSLKDHGAIAFSDDGRGVQDPQMMERSMSEAKKLEMPILQHCEDESISDGGALHCGCFSEKHTIKGIPSESEIAHVRRDIELTRKTGVHYHVCHISAAESVSLVRKAKAEGLKVTTEVTPHHLLLTDMDIPLVSKASLDSEPCTNNQEVPDTNFKMNPPLRSKEDLSATCEGLIDGTIDMIATDHAPHTSTEKARDIYKAPFGIVGLETAFPLLYTHFVLTGKMSLKALVDAMTIRPAEVFGLPWGRLREGLSADITVIDLDMEKNINPNHFLSKSQNTPFADWKVKGWPVLTILEGRQTWLDESSSLKIHKQGEKAGVS